MENKWLAKDTSLKLNWLTCHALIVAQAYISVLVRLLLLSQASRMAWAVYSNDTPRALDLDYMCSLGGLCSLMYLKNSIIVLSVEQ